MANGHPDADPQPDPDASASDAGPQGAFDAGPQGAFDAVLFDLSGTLFSQRALNGPFRVLLADLAAQAGVQADEATIRTAYRQAITRSFFAVDGDYYLHRDLFGGAFREFLVELGAPADDDLVRTAVAGQLDLTVREARLRPGVPETLTALRAAGLHVGIVSNMDDDYFDALVAKLGLGELIDAGLSSEGAGSCKPHRAIYDRALAAAGGTTPERAVFVGDTPSADIAGPRRLGFTTALVLEEGHTPRPPLDPDEMPHHYITAIPEVLNIVGIDR